ncbi:retrotransposon gag protein [Cucumis melo var. makuwa]|uniref:Retrotransposon gag protein n=1 Tax=Cucumis melo var. makuwa TaxID=1194695 RepID=A0A5A7U8D9_CUCMM|nr:retrotransposon gag protein [Cucumis melo var. makuwa]TYK07623.1 retrotransposon gag protein [Cucumis melo var. makuwa]
MLPDDDEPLPNQGDVELSQDDFEDSFCDPPTSSKKDATLVLVRSPTKKVLEEITDDSFLKGNQIASEVGSSLEKESNLEVVTVMMADVTLEAAMAERERKINLPMKAVEERDHEIIALKD